MSHGWPATLGSPATASAGLLKHETRRSFALIIMSKYILLSTVLFGKKSKHDSAIITVGGLLIYNKGTLF